MNEIVPFEFKECHYLEEWFKDMRNKKNLVQPCGSVSCSAQKVRVIEATHLFVCAFMFADCMTKKSVQGFFPNLGRLFHTISAYLRS